MYVQCLALPESAARRKACSIGHVAHAIVRDGRLLVGTWQRDISRGKRLEMDPEEYWRFRTDRTYGLCRMFSSLQLLGRKADEVSARLRFFLFRLQDPS